MALHVKRRIWVLTMFPQLLDSFCETGVVGQALRGERGPALSLKTVFISDYAPKGFKGVDDSPYGGGGGMVMRADVLREAFLQGVVREGGYGPHWRERLHLVCPAPRGPLWNGNLVRDRAQTWFQGSKDLVFICGRYQGIDERFLKNYVDEYLSLGEFIVSGGELAVMVFLDSSLRLLEGVVGQARVQAEESYTHHLLEHPQYTRPQEFEGERIPPVLISGDHRRVEDHRICERERMTRHYRPDLWARKD